MRKKSILIVGILLSVLFLSSCEDRTELNAPTPRQGIVDFTNFVSIGNSLTAGYQSGSLFESAQMYAFGNLIAQQVRTSYSQPLISDPGTAGRIGIKSLFPALTLTYNLSAGTPKNLSWPNPYNNLGIPGIVLANVLTATETANSYSKSAAIDLILRKRGTTQLAQAISLSSTSITLWIGNNDVLGFATSGGVRPSKPTDAQVFTGLYSQLADALAATGAKVVVGNIPDVTTIPFFTTVGPTLAHSLISKNVPGIYCQQHGQYNGSVLPVTALVNYSVLITLLGSNYTSYIGIPSGKFYKDNNVDITPLIAGGILDTTQAFAVHPKNPWPDALILDATEITTTKNTTAAFNTSITSIANAKGFAVVDINKMYSDIAKFGKTEDGITFTVQFVTGGLFSLD